MLFPSLQNLNLLSPLLPILHLSLLTTSLPPANATHLTTGGPYQCLPRPFPLPSGQCLSVRIPQTWEVPRSYRVYPKPDAYFAHDILNGAVPIQTGEGAMLVGDHPMEERRMLEEAWHSGSRRNAVLSQALGFGNGRMIHELGRGRAAIIQRNPVIGYPLYICYKEFDIFLYRIRQGLDRDWDYVQDPDVPNDPQAFVFQIRTAAGGHTVLSEHKVRIPEGYELVPVQEDMHVDSIRETVFDHLPWETQTGREKEREYLNLFGEPCQVYMKLPVVYMCHRFRKIKEL